MNTTNSDVTNFAALMRECLIVIMNAIPADVPRPDAFWQAQAQVVQIRQHCEKQYQAQLSKVLAHKAKPVEDFGRAALARLEAGESADDICTVNS